MQSLIRVMIQYTKEVVSDRKILEDGMSMLSRIAIKAARHSMHKLEIFESFANLAIIKVEGTDIQLEFNLDYFKVSLSSDKRSMIVEKKDQHFRQYRIGISNTIGGANSVTEVGELAMDRQYNLVLLESNSVVETICATNWKDLFFR